MSDEFELYDRVIIKGTDITGAVVWIDTDGDTKTPIYFVEKDDEYKHIVGEPDLIWLEPEKIEKIPVKV